MTELALLVFVITWMFGVYKLIEIVGRATGRATAEWPGPAATAGALLLLGPILLGVIFAPLFVLGGGQ